MIGDSRKVIIYLNKRDNEIIVYDDEESKEISSYDWVDLNDPTQLQSFIKDMMLLNNIASYRQLQFRVLYGEN